MIKRYDSEQIDKLVDIINNHGVISVPTDTVYGLCASINSDRGYKKLIELKNRPSNKLFPVMCCNLGQIKKFFIVGEKEEKIIKKFMPGPITLILNKKEDVGCLDDKYNTVAVRMAPSPELEQLIRNTGPLFMTSANISDKPVCNSLEEIAEVFPDLDGILIGSVKFNKASTIVDCTNDEYKLLRKGPITEEDLEKVLN